MTSFQLLGEPERQIVKTNCDDEGLRQAITLKYGGNAVTNPSILVSIHLGCMDTPDESAQRIVFAAEHLDGATVETEWKSLDSLIITHSRELKPSKQIERVTYEDPALNVTIQYKRR